MPCSSWSASISVAVINRKGFTKYSLLADQRLRIARMSSRSVHTWSGHDGVKREVAQLEADQLVVALRGSVNLGR